MRELTWTETSHHTARLTDEEYADLLGITMEQLAEADESGDDPEDVSERSLADELSVYSDSSFEYLERDVESVTQFADVADAPSES